MRSGRVSERATMVKMSRTRSSSSSVTRLVTSRFVLALLLDVSASVEMLPVNPSATCRTLPMVNDQSSFTFAAARVRASCGVSRCGKSPVSKASAFNSCWAASPSAGAPVTALV